MEDVDEIPVLEFVEKRAKEMKMMLEISQTVSGNDAPQQRLPRHMRRRAANHNIKRLPHTLRQKISKEMLAIPKKRPSRKHRRRPSNLLEEYKKRSSKKRWLETHIWHARRFHMDELWNCKIAKHRNDRGVRAAYRDSRKECLIIDISWLHCFEFVGLEADIMTVLEPFVCNQGESSSIFSNHYMKGQHEGETVFYKKSKVQNIPICNVKFLWKFDLVPQMKRSLFIWVHPSSADELLEHFKDILKLTSNDNNEKILTNNNIEIINRTKDFCRYKLIGPKSQSVLAAALKISTFDNKYCKDFYNFGENEMLSFCAQHKSWADLESTNPVTFPSHVVHGVLVGDPRLNMPHKRMDSNTTGIFSNFNHSGFQHFQPEISFSCIWNKDLMSQLEKIKLSTHAMNELRSGSLMSSYDPTIPILLIQDPGCTNNVGDRGHGCGWDIVLPCGWGMPFWLGLVYRGARSIGLKELKHIDYETGYPSFPKFYPDSKSGREYNLSAYKKWTSKYERMPKSKRPHYKKLKTQTPFHQPWQELCQEWNDKLLSETQESQIYFVVRDNKFLRELDKFLRIKFNSKADAGKATKLPVGKITRKVVVRGSSKCYLSVETKGVKKIILDESQMLQASVYVEQMVTTYSMGLVPVVVEFMEKGCTKFSGFCIPTADDIASFAEGKRDIFEAPGDISDNEKYDVTAIPKTTNVVNFCSRQIVGFSLTGGFSFIGGKGRLVGFVSLLGLKNLYLNNSNNVKNLYLNNANNVKNLYLNNSNNVKNQSSKIVPHNLLLVRSSTSLCYRFATIKTIYNIPH